MSIYITDCRANPRTWGSINLYEHRVIFQNHTRHNPWIIMNHQILGFPNQLQQPLPQPLSPILSEALIFFSQQRHLQGRRRQWRWSPTTMNFIATPGRDWKGRAWQNRFKNPRVNFFARFQYVSIIFWTSIVKGILLSTLLRSRVSSCGTTAPHPLTPSLLHGVFVGLGSKPVLEETPKKIRK